MVVTVLAGLFLLFVALVAYFGMRLLGRSGDPRATPGFEKCSLCGNALPSGDLVERQVGDYRILRFCRACIAALAVDATTPPSRT